MSKYAMADIDRISIPRIVYYEPQDCNAGMQNNYIVQDRRGIIYVANNYGLLEFDGSTWATYHVSNGTKVRSIAIDGNGNVHVGAQNQFGYFSPNLTGEFVYHSLSDSLPIDSIKIDEVWDTFYIDEKVFYTSFNHIHSFDGKTLSSFKAPGRIENSFLVNNQLYIQVINVGLFVFDGKVLTPLVRSKKISSERISALIQLNKNELLVATTSGIYTFDGNSFKPWNKEYLQHFDEVFINDAIFLSSYELAIGTRNKGIFILSIDGTLVKHLHKGHGFNNRDIMDIMEDSYGNIWIAQNNGLAKIEFSSAFTYINENSGVEGAGYCSFQNSSGIFLGTNNGLYFFDKQKSYEPSILIEQQVYSLEELNGSLFVGHDQGAFVYDKNNISKFSGAAGSWKYMIPKNNRDALIEGNYFGFASYDLSKKIPEKRKKMAGLVESSRVFEEDSDGTIWMTHGYKGVYKLFPNADYSGFDSVRYYNQNDGFSTNQLINVFRINNELLFCSGQGIYVYDPATDYFNLHPEFSQLLGSDIHIRYMEEDIFGNVYFIAASKSGRLKKDRFGNYTLETSLFNKVHDQLNDDLEDINASDVENIVFGAQNGFILYNSTKNTSLDQPIYTLIRQVTNSNKGNNMFKGSFMNEDKIVIDQPARSIEEVEYEENSVVFHYSCTYTGDTKNTKYQYLLEGYDETWSGWNTTTNKEYTNLKEGTYTFRVKAKNSHETLSNEAFYTITILPPWYRTKLAYFSYLFGGLALIIGVLYSQSARHKYEKKAMTIQQKRELIKKDNELVQLTEKTSAEIIKLENEKLELDISSKNKELASTTMNLIDKNQLLSGLKTDLEQALNKEDQKLTKRSLKEMIKKIDYSLSHDDEWERFQQYFDDVHGDFSQRLRKTFENLSPQEVKLSTYLRMNLSTKEIAQLMNITSRGVEIARYRLRKKLNLSREINLTEFIGRF